MPDIVKRGWETYEKLIMQKYEMSEDMQFLLKMTYYAGSMQMYDLHTQLAKQVDVEDEASVRWALEIQSELHEELTEFSQHMAALGHFGRMREEAERKAER